MMADAPEPGEVPPAPGFTEMGDAVVAINPCELAECLHPVCGTGPIERVLGGKPAQFLPPEQEDITEREGRPLNPRENIRVVDGDRFGRLQGGEAGKD